MDQGLDDESQSARQIGLLNDDDYEASGSSHQPPPLPPAPPGGLLSFSPYTKFNISPNRPNANAHLELKSIERPRSHSPLKPRMGIDQYVETYKSSSGTTSSNENKIMMNLRMDDLLSSSKSGAAQYQAIDELGFMNANEPDVVYGSKRNSIVDKSGFRSRNSQSEEDENDADAEDVGVENEYEDAAASSLKYKYTATYRKDEATGSFQEQSKIVFEKSAGAASKPSRPPPPPPPPTSFSTFQHTTSSTDYTQHRDLPAYPSPPLLDNSEGPTNPFITSTTSQVSTEPPTSRTSAGPPLAELNSILAALNANSQKLESKIDHEEDMRPSSNIYIDATSSSTTSNTTNTTETIKQKNESFFIDILSKSDDLIAQTQNKLERLSKLDTVAKPIGPVLSTTPVAPKAKPVPSQVPNAGTPPSNSQQQVPPRVSPSPVLGENTSKNQPNLLLSQSTNIIPSKSLIDFKADGNSSVVDSTEPATVAQSQMIDLLLDISEENPANSTLVLSTEPMKQNESYFDLIGLNKSNSQFSLTGSQQTSGVVVAPGSSLLELLSEENGNISVETSSSFKDDLLDSMLGISEPPPPLPSSPIPTRPAPPAPPSSLSLKNVIQVETGTVDDKSECTVPTIDILITEPQSEKDDDNIVPEGYFNLMHDVPKDQSRPHSPVSSPHASTMPSTQSYTSYVSKTTTTTNTKPAYSFKFGVGQTTYDASMSRARPRPVSPVVQQRPPTPPSRSRPASPLISPSRSKHTTILEDDLSILNGAGNELNELEKSVNYLLDNSGTNAGTTSLDQDTLKKKKKRNKVR